MASTQWSGARWGRGGRLSTRQTITAAIVAKLGIRSVEAYDASAQETIAIGTRFTYRDVRTHERRVGYYHRDTARFVGMDLDGYIRTHHRLDEGDVYALPESTYWDD